MVDFPLIIRNALEYFDDNKLKHYDKINSFKFYKVDTKTSTINFYNKKKEVVLTTKYEYIGKYLPDTHTWIWGWAVSELSKEQVNTSLKTFDYAFEINNITLKAELITSRYLITSPIQTDMHIALVSYLSKKPFVYELNTSKKVNITDEIFPIQHKLEDVGTTYYLILN